MATKRKTYSFRDGEIVDIEEFHDGRYGAPGKSRMKKRKPTKEDMQKVNAWNKTKKARQRLLTYFTTEDLFITLTYRMDERPPNMAEALNDFQKAIRKIRSKYKKQGRELFWIRNIERGTKGAWHIHIIINEIGDTASIVKKAWNKGGVFVLTIRDKPEWNDGDFTELAAYITKDENTVEYKQDGTPAKPRIKETSYSRSRNMPLTEPEVDRLVRWKKEPKPKKGYYILRIHEGINPKTGYKYRKYTMVRLHRRI